MDVYSAEANLEMELNGSRYYENGNALAGIAKSILDGYFEVGEAGEVDTYENQRS